jgi:hypothetical protein
VSQGLTPLITLQLHLTQAALHQQQQLLLQLASLALHAPLHPLVAALPLSLPMAALQQEHQLLPLVLSALLLLPTPGHLLSVSQVVNPCTPAQELPSPSLLTPSQKQMMMVMR